MALERPQFFRGQKKKKGIYLESMDQHEHGYVICFLKFEGFGKTINTYIKYSRYTYYDRETLLRSIRIDRLSI